MQSPTPRKMGRVKNENSSYSDQKFKNIQYNNIYNQWALSELEQQNPTTQKIGKVKK